jgi:putative membrane protein
MNSIKVLITVLSISACAAAVTSCNNSGNSPMTDSTATLGEKISAMADSTKAALTPDPNKSFVQDASTDNTRELAWLQAGVDHGTSRELKAHAKMMIADHKQLADQLAGYASAKGIELPATDTAGVASLSEKPGKDWDKAWTDKMVSAHKDAIDKFEHAQNSVTDPDLKAIIDKTLPTLRKHYDMVKGMQDKMD